MYYYLNVKHAHELTQVRIIRGYRRYYQEDQDRASERLRSVRRSHLLCHLRFHMMCFVRFCARHGVDREATMAWQRLLRLLVLYHSSHYCSCNHAFPKGLPLCQQHSSNETTKQTHHDSSKMWLNNIIRCNRNLHNQHCGVVTI